MSQTATILVIDDEPQIRKFLRISLASQGYKVLEAGNGAEGLASAALNKPDILVLDLGLSLFFLVYTFAFNLGFDKVFGLPASAA